MKNHKMHHSILLVLSFPDPPGCHSFNFGSGGDGLGMRLPAGHGKRIWGIATTCSSRKSDIWVVRSSTYVHCMEL